MQKHFPVQTLESAPLDSRPALLRLRASVGMIPNLAGAMASSPPLITAFATLREQLETGGTFDAREREIIALVNAVENGCRYCTAIHATFGQKAGLSADTLERLRAKGDPSDPRQAALAGFARRLLQARGALSGAELEAFCAAGFTPAQALELVARLALSVLANYAGSLTQPPVDDMLKPQYL